MVGVEKLVEDLCGGVGLLGDGGEVVPEIVVGEGVGSEELLAEGLDLVLE